MDFLIYVLQLSPSLPSRRISNKLEQISWFIPTLQLLLVQLGLPVKATFKSPTKQSSNTSDTGQKPSLESKQKRGGHDDPRTQYEVEEEVRSSNIRGKNAWTYYGKRLSDSLPITMKFYRHNCELGKREAEKFIALRNEPFIVDLIDSFYMSPHWREGVFALVEPRLESIDPNSLTLEEISGNIRDSYWKL